jgi:hypothetical protein
MTATIRVPGVELPVAYEVDVLVTGVTMALHIGLGPFQLQAEVVALEAAFHVLHRAAEDHPPLVHHAHVVADMVDIAEDVGGDDDGAVLAQLADQVIDLGVQTSRGDAPLAALVP